MSETTWCPKCGSNSYRVPGEGDVYLDCGDRLILECNACGTQYHEPESPALLETAPMTDDRAEPHEWLRKTDDELVAKASKIISDMCHGDKWRMCIPVQPDDSDVVLGTLVRRFNELRAATVSAGRLREALTFYAEGRNVEEFEYESDCTRYSRRDTVMRDTDGGDVARAALGPPADQSTAPTDTERLDWWFERGMDDSVCEGSVDLWWADEQDGDAVVRVTHGTSVRDVLDKAMRGIYDGSDAALSAEEG
jgi:hypothetical protein